MKIKKKGIYILPNLFTSANLFCGFYALVAVVNSQYYRAALAILIAIVFDGLDGKIARATDSSTDFGLEYDSLADIISFGLAPSLLIYGWVLKPYGRIGWMAVFLFVICASLRLARFNIQNEKKKYSYFTGLPTPAAAAVISSWVIMTRDIFFIQTEPILMMLTVYLLAFLMVSNIKYRSFKHLELFRRKKNFSILVFFILIVYIVATLPELMFFLLALSYTLSGPGERFIFSWKQKGDKKVSEYLEPDREYK